MDAGYFATSGPYSSAMALSTVLHPGATIRK
jgi:hypothetical protein